MGDMAARNVVNADTEEDKSQRSDEDEEEEEGDDADSYVVDDATVAMLLGANADSCDATLDAIDQDSDAAPDSSSECEGALQESADETLQAEDWGNKTDTIDSGSMSDSSVVDGGEKG